MTLLERESVMRPSGGKETALRDWVRALEATAPIAANPQRVFPVIVEELARQRGDAPALLSADESLSFRALSQRANRYARWALAQGLAKGQTVALLMPNRPEYLAIWLGVTATGAVVSLLNIHLRGAALAHCIEITAPRALIVAAELVEALNSAAPYRSGDGKVWLHGGAVGVSNDGGEFARLDHDIERYAPEPLNATERRGVTLSDRALNIYTSGTTGLPKAANISHHRLLQWSLWFGGLLNTGPDDRMYNCLPMYHSIGGVVATGAVLVNGGSVVIREKFSARQFWDDIAGWDCTLFQYIGELVRYLVNAPEHPREREHRLRLCCGNGLGADIWEKFQTRFQIPRILEFYAATEGNVSLFNVEGKPGAIGRVPSFLAHRFPLALVKFDPVTEMPARDGNGFCVRCQSGEIGEAIGRIRGDAAPAGGEFEGYTSPEETERKILRDVFERGDAWYRTGDLMRRDASGYYYFVDRIGDTFRWKGENVAASEVAAAIVAFPGIAEASVYGVRVPEADGAAGMAALVVDGPLDFAAFRRHLAAALPSYARPLFLRIKDHIALTETFKQKKNELVRDGFNPAASDDALYFDDPSRQAYVTLGAALYDRIAAGQIRL